MKTNTDAEILSKIQAAQSLLAEASSLLLASGEAHYESGDNWRGNTRHDAGKALARLNDDLIARTGHLPAALAK